MIIGTAGHIDHGKSALIAALTGRPMDRLAEEKRRGITIDLNFAPLDLGGGHRVGVVDVPGHEDFVRTMVAGASGIDLVLLVIDAAEGPRPQTLEHLAIVSLLGIPAGIPVITKADLADPEWVELVTQEVREMVARSTTRFEEPLVVSARTGQGLEELRARIAVAAAAWTPARERDLFRMPVDRVFALPGVGTVVTGTVWAGTCSVGESVRVLPGLPGQEEGRPVRVRSIEGFGEQVDLARAGYRHAIGMVGLGKAEVHRGQVMVDATTPWVPTSVLDVVIHLEASAPAPLGHRARVRVHLGTAEVLGRVYPRGALIPGGTASARLVLETPVVARGKDRFVLRRYSPMTTIGGGSILDPSPGRRARWLPGLEGANPMRLPALVARRLPGLPEAELPVVLGLPTEDARALAADHPDLLLLNGRWFLRSAVARAAERATQLLTTWHAREPAAPGMSLETLRSGLRGPSAVGDQAIQSLVRAGTVQVTDGVAALCTHRPTVAGGDATIDRVVAALEQHGLGAPGISELERELGIQGLPAILRLAAARGVVEAVERDWFLATSALGTFADAVRDVASRGDGTVTPADLRTRLGLSRKFLIPLLEWSDRKGITERVGEGRRLRNSPVGNGPSGA